ncbi:MAG: Trp family transcriptional regulator [bacterium]
MENDHLSRISSELQNAFLHLKTKDEVFAFLRDLLTQDEIVEFSLRLSIAQKLFQGHNYKQIEKET